MAIHVEFVGGARTVTGSAHLVRTPHARVLLDCGLFQGRRREAFERNRDIAERLGPIDAVVLSHAHIDHSGALPILARHGFRGDVVATPASCDLAAAMLADAAMIQAADARYVQKLVDRGELARPEARIEPLYEQRDVDVLVAHLRPLPYGTPLDLLPGVRVTLFDAGHVLGSAVVALDLEDAGSSTRLVFTGDLGRANMPILRDPQVVDGARVLITESTYGDRVHEPIERMDEALAAVVRRTFERGGRVIIPSFARERAQEVLYALKRIERAGLLPAVRVFVDSPLTVRVTDVFRAHPDCYDEQAAALFAGGDSPFDLPGLRYVRDAEESKALVSDPDPYVVISASGMCESGRILHHLRAGIGDERNTVVLVGYQAPHTLGRRLVEKRTRVRIFGIERERRCEVVVLNGFSAHADQRDLVAYAEATRDRGALEQVVLVHGDPTPQARLRQALGERGFDRVAIPAPGDVLTI